MAKTAKERLIEELKIGSGKPRPVKAPTGTELHCKGWHQEAALRMLCNNLDPSNGENPDELIVYGGYGKAARNWPCFDALVRTLLDLENDETMLVQSGKPVGVIKTHPHSPRVLIANSNLVGHWDTWEHFHELDKKGLMMYGQMTAGSWIYIGTQGILQGTYETFASLALQHFQGDLSGRIVVSGGLGGMGGAQPLAVTMNNGVALIVDVDCDRIQRRLDTKYLDTTGKDLSQAMGPGQGGGPGREAALHRALRQLRRGPAGHDRGRVHPGRGHGPDLGPRRAQRLRPGRDRAGGRLETPPGKPGQVHGHGPGVHGRALPGHSGDAEKGRGGFRLRQQSAGSGRQAGGGQRL